MKLTVKERAGCAEKVILECDTTESLYINSAMRRYASDVDVDEESRERMEKILEAKPVFEEVEE